MNKALRTIIGIGFLIVVIGGMICVGGQMISLVIGQPALMVTLDETISKVIFPAAAVSGLLCFFYYYLFPNEKPKKGDD